MIKLYTEEEFNNAKSNIVLPLKCEYCGKIYYRCKKEILFEEVHQRGRCRFCSQECQHLFYTTQNIVIKCENCGKEKQITLAEYNKSKTKHFFCNRSCSATYNNTQRKLSKETKNKISDSLQKVLKETYENQILKDTSTKKENKEKKLRVYKNLKLVICQNCNNSYVRSKTLFPTHTKICCCKECFKEHRQKINSSFEYREKLSIAGRHSVKIQSEFRRSKNEKLFCEKCEKHFKNVKHNEAIFNGWDADVILEDEKIAILWNGKWHYEQISKKVSLEQIQNRDKIKLNEIQKCGYKPYVIKDMGKFNPLFVQNEFEKFIKLLQEYPLF